MGAVLTTPELLVSDTEFALIKAIVDKRLRRDDVYWLSPDDKKALRRLYLRGYINAQPVLWQEGPPHDLLFPNGLSKVIAKNQVSSDHD